MFKLLSIFFLSAIVGHTFELPSASTQCLVGVAKDWNSSHVTLQLYQKQDKA
jgi:hypothetical protein